MAAKRIVKKSGKKAPLKKSGHKKQAKKPIGRKKPMGSGRTTTDRSPRARKTGASSGLTTKEPVRRSGSPISGYTGPMRTPVRKAVRSGRTIGRKTRKRPETRVEE
jgi:hypothetical protein